MKELLESKVIRERLNETRLNHQLRTLVESKVVEIDGCFFLEGLLRQGFDASQALAQSHDRTDLESSVNHIHIPLWVGEDVDWSAQEIFAQAFKYAIRLSQQLQERGHFKVVFSYDNEASAMSTVRFYLARPDEEWLSDDIESYQTEAVLAIDTGEN